MPFFLAECGSLWQSQPRPGEKANKILAETRGVLAETRGVLAVCKLFLAVFGSLWQSAEKNKKEITLSLLIGYWHFLTFYFNQTAKFLIFSISGAFSFCSDAPKCDIVTCYFFPESAAVQLARPAMGWRPYPLRPAQKKRAPAYGAQSSNPKKPN